MRVPLRGRARQVPRHTGISGSHFEADVMILVGELALWVGLLMAAWCATVSFAGGRLGRADLIASGERAAYATVVLVILASIGLWTAILTHDFSLKYVASFTSSNLPTV